jgi:hypothetical protein
LDLAFERIVGDRAPIPQSGGRCVDAEDAPEKPAGEVAGIVRFAVRLAAARQHVPITAAADDSELALQRVDDHAEE